MLQRQELRKAGLKVTLPRLKILEILETSEPRHLSAEDIYRQLLDTGEDIGLATVYRVLTQFEAAGLVTRHNFEGGHSVFEMDDGTHHDHMVCIESGEVVEFTNDEIERIQREIAKSQPRFVCPPDQEEHGRLILPVRRKYLSAARGIPIATFLQHVPGSAR
jgi:Fur family ferric uptake transcriptional regulator